MDSISIFWFRRDLRLNDNTALNQALANSKNVLPLFIFDEEILSELPLDDARFTFIHDRLCIIDQMPKGKSD
jgi:deoxyribodipyrimidine photo-lyase